MADQAGIGEWAVLKRVLAQGWQHKWMIALTLAATVTSGSLIGVLAISLAQILSLIGSAQSDVDPAKAVTLITMMNTLGLRFLLLAPIAAIAAYVSWWSGQWVANRSMMDLRNRLLGHLVRLDLAFHGELTRGDLLTRLTADLESMLKLQQLLYGKVLQRPIECVFWTAALIYLDWRLAAVIGVVVGIAMALIAPVIRRTRRRSQQARATMALNLSVLEQITAGIRVIKAMGSAERESQRYSEHNQRFFNDNTKVARARAQSDALTGLAIFGMVGGGLLMAAALFQRHMLEPAVLFSFVGILARLISVVREVQRGWGDAQEQFPGAERVYAILDRPSRITDRPGAVPCPKPTQGIRLEQVHFKYSSESEEVLRGIDLDIPAGGTIALVGPAGIGKSTILDLIPRFHDVTGGRITIDGVDLRDYQHASLVAQMAIVSQDNFLFHDTIFNNIRYGRPSATREEVEAAARRASVHDAILALEGGQGYDTVAGDRGSKLSGGQRQRVVIARALLRDAPILLLDEPTSALDADSERLVQAGLAELMKGRTTIIIAHRLATVQHADRIYVLAPKDHPARGTVLETGTHAELVKLDGQYARLVKLQTLN